MSIPVYQDFSKNDRKLIQPLIGRCVNAEIAAFTQKNLPNYQALAQSNAEDLRPAYWEIADAFQQFSKDLRSRYDNNSHRYLPSIIARTIADELLPITVLDEFSEAGKEKMLGAVQLMRQMDE